MEKDIKFIRSFFIRTFILLAAVIAEVVILDPFYQYHKPLPGLKAVLTDKEYQCIGTLRTFDYDALIVALLFVKIITITGLMKDSAALRSKRSGLTAQLQICAISWMQPMSPTT